MMKKLDRMVLLLTLLPILVPSEMIGTASGQEPLPPELQAPFNAIIQEMRFEKPTKIMGRLVAMDAYEKAIWIEWTYRHDGSRWIPLEAGRQFKVFPRNDGMMQYFRALKLGANLRLLIQADEDGNRRVLEIDESA
jgi:hypothetical protein